METERLLTATDAVEVLVVGQVNRVQRLRQMVLKWAFEGKLVDQDSSDEPASMLLDRTRLERQSAGRTTSVPRIRSRRRRTA
jgi:type I restriction enzyme S subunit